MERTLPVLQAAHIEFENGRDYYALHGRALRPPQRSDLAPGREFLDWHAGNVFRG